MPGDEIAEGLIRPVFRFLGQIIFDIVLNGACHFIGFYTLRFITLGRYPPKANQPYSEILVVAVGFLVLICFAAVTVFGAYN